MLIGKNQPYTSLTKAKCGGECQPKPPGEECPGHGNDAVEIGGQSGKAPEGVHKKWLFMNYIAADCNLKEFQAKNIDNQELVGSDDNTHIVAMIDIGPAPKAEEAGEAKSQQVSPDVQAAIDFINSVDIGDGPGQAGATEKEERAAILDWSGGKTFYVTKDTQLDKINSPVIAEHGPNVNMTDPKTLTNFIVDTMKKFPADNVALIMNDHGGGWVSAMSDDTNGGSFSMPQIKQALADAEKVTGKKIDVFGFDACLMADAQAAYEFKDVANFYLASEETEGGPGWTYDNMLNGSHEGSPKEITNSVTTAMGMLQAAMEQKITVGPEEFCKLVVKCNEEHQQDIPTFSATDLTKMDGVAQATDELAKAILKTEEKEAVKNAILEAQSYGGGWAPYNDMHDMTHMAQLIGEKTTDPALKKAAEGIKKAVGEAVIANEAEPTKYGDSHGLHIFAGFDGSEDAGYQQLGFAKDTQWDEAVKELGKIQTGREAQGAGGMEALFQLLTGDEPGKMWPDGTPRK